MKKILFLTLYPDHIPSSRFRIGQYQRFLRADGFQTQIVSAIPEICYRRFAGAGNWWRAMGYHISEFLCRLATLLRRSDHDVVVLQKAILSFYLRGMEKFLERFRDRLVFDMDDSVYLRAPNPLPVFTKFMQDESQIQQVMRISRCVLVANEALALVARKFSNAVRIIPTPVDTDYFVGPSAAWEDKSVFRLLWMGNRSGNHYVNCLAPVFAILQGDGIKAQLTVLSDSRDFVRTEYFPANTVLFRKWSLQEEKACLQSAHAGLMPLDDTPWNRAKSGFKTMLYMACGLPTVSSPVGNITDVVRNGENGFIARTQEEWASILQRIWTEQKLRVCIGNNARQTILRGYSVAVQYPRFKQALLESTNAVTR